MATTYLSENDLPSLQERMSEVFVEKPLVALIILSKSNWVLDPVSGKYKTSALVSTADITGEPIGEVNLYLENIEKAKDRLNMRKAASDANVRLFGHEMTSTGLRLDFYSDFVPLLDIPLSLTLNNGVNNG